MTGMAASLIARIRKQRDLMTAMDEHCKSISARVTSRDQAVSVEVDGLGAMTGLWFGPGVSKLSADALATAIVETAHAAAKVAADRQAYLIGEFEQRMHELQTSALTRRDGTTFDPAKD
jgi:hypothetical protein